MKALPGIDASNNEKKAGSEKLEVWVPITFRLAREIIGYSDFLLERKVVVKTKEIFCDEQDEHAD